MAVLLIGAVACKKGENAGLEEAKKEAEAEAKKHATETPAATKINPPVPGRAKLACGAVIDLDKFKQALGETEALGVTDEKESDAAASCSIKRGGKPVSAAEQAALKKKQGRLGVLPGDEICNVTLYCWTIEDAEKEKQRCHDLKDHDDDTLGFYSCMHINMQGEDDVKSFKFFDGDTKCLFWVRPGPSNVDNDLITKCAKAAGDLIGPDQIKPGAAPPAPPAEPAGSGSAAGSAK